MKTLTKITLVGACLSVIIHVYLAFHYYPVKFGFSSGPSICSVNATFDCDAVAASQYSAVFDIPVALWGAALNLVIFGLALAQWWGWSENTERLRRWVLLLLGVSVTASVGMGVISTRLQNYCLFCISLYVLSIIMFECYRRTLSEPFFRNIGGDIASLVSDSKGVLVGLAMIPLLAYLGNSALLENYGLSEVQHLVQVSVSEWQSNPSNDIIVAPSLSEGAPRGQAKLVLAEFADFRCHHCKNAYPVLERFSKSHPNVRLEFFNFPLDGACNEGMASSGLSCRLAAAVQCASKQSESFGWALHHAVYEAQDDMVQLASVEQIDQKLAPIVAKVGLNAQTLMSCMNDPQTVDAIRQQAKQGRELRIEGTPAIFGNGRMLPRGQLIPVLEAALDSSH